MAKLDMTSKAMKNRRRPTSFSKTMRMAAKMFGTGILKGRCLGISVVVAGADSRSRLLRPPLDIGRDGHVEVFRRN